MKDKYDQILEAISNPERLNKEELDALLSDPEIQRLYQLLSKTADACTSPNEPDIDKEWQEFAAKHKKDSSWQRISHFLSHKAAAVFIGVFISMAVVAATIGIGNRLIKRHGESGLPTKETPAAVISQSDKDVVTDSITAPQTAEPETIVFKNKALAQILHAVTEYYGYELKVGNEDCLKLKLYFKWNQALPIDEVIEQLNNFEQIHLTVEGEMLTVN